MNRSRRSSADAGDQSSGSSPNVARMRNDSSSCCHGAADGKAELDRRRRQNRDAQRKYRSNMQQRLQELDQIKSVLGISDFSTTAVTAPPLTSPPLVSPPLISPPLVSPPLISPSTTSYQQEQAWPGPALMTGGPMPRSMSTVDTQLGNPESLNQGRGQMILSQSQQQCKPSSTNFVDSNTLTFEMYGAADSSNLDLGDDLLDATINKQIDNSSLDHSEGGNSSEPVLPSLRSTLNMEHLSSASNTPLHLAACGVNVQTVRSLLRHGALVNSVNVHGDTPLHIAAAKGHLVVVHCLLEAGADVRARNVFDITPMHAAVLRGHAAVVDRLIQSGADPNDIINASN